jgi:hypothetical protein
MTGRLPSDTPFGAGLLFVGAVQVAILANPLTPLQPQQRAGERRTAVRAWPPCLRLLPVIAAWGTSWPRGEAAASGAVRWENGEGR